MKGSLKASGVINIILSCLVFFTVIFGGIISLVIFAFLLSTGIIFLNYSELNDLSEKKDIILILSILCIPVSFISALINLINIGKISSSIKERAPNIDPETKRIDALIKLGIVLISLAGIIFISSDWNNFSGYLVVIFLLILTIIFYSLYKLFTIKIKLNSSSKLYFILSSIFVLLIYLACGHYDLIGDWFSTTGLGSSLYFSLFWVITSLLTFNLKEITDSDIRVYFGLIFSTLSIYALLEFFGFGHLQILVIINIIALFIKYISRNSYILDYVNVLIKIFIGVAGISLFSGYSTSLLILVLINLVVVNYLNIKTKSVLYQISAPLVTIFYSIILLGEIVYEYSYSFNDYILFICGILSTIYILIMCTKIYEYKLLCKRIYSVTYNIVFFIFSIISLFLDSYVLLIVILIRILVLFSYYFFEYRNGIKGIEYYIIPIKLSVLLLSILVYLNNYIDITASIVLLSIIGMLSCYYIFIDNKVLNLITFILVWFFTFINMFVIIFSENDIILALSLFSVSLPFILSISKNKDYCNGVSFSYLLLSSFLILNHGNYEEYYGIIINILLYGLLFIIFYKNKRYVNLLLLAIVLPIMRLVSEVVDSYDFVILIDNMLVLYLIYIINSRYVKEFENKKVLFIIISSFSFLFIMFAENYIFGLYLGIISLILILYSSMKDNYKSIFIYGIVLLSINLLFRLRTIWYKIPLWGYLLIAGLTIIVFATMKELKKMNNKK